MEDLLKDFSVVIAWPVAWRDMDALRHVNSVRYFEYFEHVRLAYGEKCGTIKLGEATGQGPILAEISISFKKPLFFPDTVSLGVRVSKIEKTQYFMDFIVVSHSLKVVAATGFCRNVYYDYNIGERAEIPESIISNIENIEGKPFELA